MLKEVDAKGEIADTGSFAAAHSIDHNKIAGVALSLESIGFAVKKVGTVQLGTCHKPTLFEG